MSRLSVILFALFNVFVASVVVGGLWLKHEVSKPGTFAEEKQILIQPGSTGRGVANQLERDALIDNAKIFYGLLRIQNASIKAGEYALPAKSSMKAIADILRGGQTIQRQFTLAEGLTVKQAVVLLRQNDYLDGTIDAVPAEGSLLPETYSFTRGETRTDIIKRMQDARNAALDDLWDKRDPSLPLKSKDEAVILASIVEKETGKGEERAKIAGLFYNRLKIGMPLQTDPTVVYAITDGLGHMGGKPLLSKHLAVDSPYNTYKIVGLPPAPIANPGKASLQAVFHPEHHNYLFFVADGTGGHVFSESLSGHNKNVTQWRKIKKELNKK